MATNLDLYIDQGSDFSRDIVVTGVDGTAMDLTGYDAICQMKRSYYSLTGITITADISSPSDGVITLALSNTDTASLFPARYVYEVQIINSNNVKTRVYEGEVYVSPGVTNTSPTRYEVT